MKESTQTAAPPIAREVILNRIGDEFGMVIQWARCPGTWSRAAGAYEMAKCLIEILEVEDCGQVGGFDKDQPPPRRLFDRWDWLFRKYHNPEGRRFCSGIFSYEGIRDDPTNS
jgi:hypothetical protein